MRSFRGDLARSIGIEIHDYAAREPAEQLDLRLGKAGAAARDHVRDARARHRDRVHVSFDENRDIALPDRFFRAVEVIEEVALRIDRRLGRIHVFRHVVAHRATAECDHFAGIVRDREHDAAAEAIVETPALIARKESGDFEQRLGILRLELAQQRVAGRWRPSEAESLHGFAIEAAILQIRRCDLAFRCLVKLPREKRRRLLVHLDERGSLLVLASLFGRALARLRNRNAALFADRAQRLGKRALVELHHKFEYVAARAAAKAVVNLPHRMHRKRRRLLLMERAQPREILPGLLQAHVFADHADDVRLLLHLLRE